MNLSKDHILQYLNGELPHYEQHEIEKIMLDDPFLSDAIEGLREIDDPEKLTEVLKELEGFVESNYGKVRKVIPLYRNPLAIAATITFIFISVSIVFFIPDYREKALSFLNPKEDSDQIRQSELENVSSFEEEDERPLETTDLDSSIIPTLDETPSLALNDAPATEDFSIIEQADEADQFLSGEEQIPEDALNQRDIAATNIVNEDTISELVAETGFVDDIEQLAENEGFEPQGVSSQAAQAARKSVALEAEDQIPFEGKVISGIIVSLGNNQPLSGVNVFLAGTPRGVLTDNSGAYEMTLLESVDQLELSLIGYQPARIDVSQPGIHNISLQRDVSQRSEFMVIGSSGESRLDDPDQFAGPDSGRTAYNRYISENLNYPSSAAENEISGRVVVEFTVSGNGTISNIQVVNSLGFGCDEEAARLILNGPRWRPAIKNGVPAQERLRISILFGT